MRSAFSLFCAAAASVYLVACGGGSALEATPSVAQSSAPPLGAAPTYVVKDTLSEAQSSVNEVVAGYAGSRAAAEGLSFRVPGGIWGSAWTTSGGQTMDCARFGGSGSIMRAMPSTNIGTGTTIAYTYNNCSLLGFNYTGTFSLTFTQYTSPTDFSYVARWSNFSFSGNGLSSGTYDGSQTCRMQGVSLSCAYRDAQGRTWSNAVSANGGLLNGSYSVNYGNGVITVTYTNFGATGGTARITGANNTEILITRTGTHTFTVAITVNARTTTYTINLGG